MRHDLVILTFCASLLAVIGVNEALSEYEIQRRPASMPPGYAAQHMPSEWWGDDNILAEGKAIYEGVTIDNVNCVRCHGMDGKPVGKATLDLSDTKRMKMHSDSTLFYLISEGVVETKMKSWKSRLSEGERWKLVAYVASFGLKGMAFDTENGRWVPVQQGPASQGR